MLEILAIVVITVLGIASVEWDNWFGGTVTFIGTLAAVQWWFALPVWATIVANPLLIISALVAYIVVGVAYSSLIRYPRWLASRQEQINTEWVAHCRANPDNIDEEAFHASYRFRPFTAASNSDRLAVWAAMWPWGVSWDIINRPVRAVYQHIHQAFGRALVKIERRAISRAPTRKGP